MVNYYLLKLDWKAFVILNNLRIVTPNEEIERGYIEVEGNKILSIGKKPYVGNKESIDKEGLIAFPGFIDIHIHGSMGIDFMDAREDDYKIIASSLYEEGVTTFLATTLTSDKSSLARVCETIAKIKKDVPSLGGIHFEGPYISLKYKGAQNPEFIRDPDIEEFEYLQKEAKGNVRYISLAPERPNALPFIKKITSEGVVVSAGHTEATFDEVEKAIEVGLTNTTHTHNAMSPHHHRNPGVVTAAMYFDSLFTEVICDLVHVCPNTLKAFYKIVGPNRFVAITDALKVKHSEQSSFQLFGLDCIRKEDAAYLSDGKTLAGSILFMDQGLRNVRNVTKADNVSLAKMFASNAARSLHFDDRGTLEEGKLADIVLLDHDYSVKEVYKEGNKVK